eukprot:CAMPEP_0173419508 /NCGR_PEP_ID=MMETSP1357-20121228/1316_1 /TAXON_ID=77926 /ORGANISM="Hemiselmis rufescens, Strain PCC563" /LENGTH=404 /DNA_ID=CAMNT_0014382157 /DNA_START=337 /DNA_END=1551 /DNA_ORIENTATION=-
MESCYRCHRPVGDQGEHCQCKHAFYCSAKCKTAHAKAHALVCTVELKKQLDTSAKKFGPTSCETAAAIIRLADVYDDQDREAAAEAGYAEAQSILRDNKAAEASKLASTLQKLANTRLRLGRAKEALIDVEEASSIFAKVHGDERHVDTAGCLVVEGEVLGALTRYQEALERLERAYEMLKALFGETHEKVAGALSSIAHILMSKGKKNAALKMYEKAVGIQRKTMGEARVGISLLNLGRLYVETGAHEKGVITLQEGLNIAKRTCGAHSLVAGKFMVTIGWAYTEMKRNNAAHSVLEEAVQVLRRERGEGHEDVADALYHLSVCELQMKDTFGAKTHVKEAQGIYDKKKSVLVDDGKEGEETFQRVSSASGRVDALVEQLESDSGWVHHGSGIWVQGNALGSE